MKIPLIIICGPTASGKTSLSIELAKALNGEIISADSMQIYKHMDIGTAKPTLEEREGIAHHLMDIIEPTESFSVSEYVELAHKAAADIHSRGKLAIVVGGTGLYIDSLAKDMTFGESFSDTKIRDELSKYDSKQLLSMLAEFDPETAESYHENNRRRIIRAIEFYRLSGKTISQHRRETQEIESRYAPVYFMIDHDRQRLYDRIDKRVDIMLADGLVSEFERVVKMGVTRDMTSMQGIGYKQLFGVLDGEYPLDEAVEIIKRDSRRYAKRQLTWFRRNAEIHMLDPENPIEEALKIIRQN